MALIDTLISNPPEINMRHHSSHIVTLCEYCSFLVKNVAFLACLRIEENESNEVFVKTIKLEENEYLSYFTIDTSVKDAICKHNNIRSNMSVTRV